MFKGIPYSNKIMKRREQERNQMIHKQNLKNVRPITTNLQFSYETLYNNKKKQMLQEDRFTQIERSNQILLEKITSIMAKKPSFKRQRSSKINSINSDKQRMNKSLNQGFRNKQLEDIQIQNAKLLKRIMDKKSDYQAQKLKQEWKKQKQVIKNIANYPFIIRDKIYKGRRKSTTSHSSHQVNLPLIMNTQSENLLTNPVQLVRIRKLQGENFLITLRYDGQKLQILGDNKSKKEIKVIEVPRDEALEFIHFECDGKIETIFDCLRYSSTDGTLYLVGKGVQIQKVDTKNDIDVVEKTQKKPQVLKQEQKPILPIQKPQEAQKHIETVQQETEKEQVERENQESCQQSEEKLSEEAQIVAEEQTKPKVNQQQV